MLKRSISSLSDVPNSLREHYAKQTDGTFKLEADEHPDTAKLAEFRDSNVILLKERDALKAQYEGIDEEYKTLKAKAAAGDGAELAAVRAELATEKTARAAAQAAADASVLKSTVTDAFLKAGGRPKALGYIVAQAAPVFTVVNGALKSTQFSPTRPGESLTLDEFIASQLKDSDFAFEASRGGGATGGGGGRSTSGVRELRDPTPQDLGKFSREIAAGEMRVVYSS
jgi:hypothetical protein